MTSPVRHRVTLESLSNCHDERSEASALSQSELPLPSFHPICRVMPNSVSASSAERARIGIAIAVVVASAAASNILLTEDLRQMWLIGGATINGKLLADGSKHRICTSTTNNPHVMVL